MTASAPLIVIAAGGTGGHMFPAQALAEAMLKDGWRVRLATDARGARYAGGFPDVVERRVLSAATTARGGALAKLLVPVRIAVGVIAATVSMLADRPKVVAGFGGYPTVPAMAAAWLVRAPRLIHEANGVLGRVNAAFARRVHVVACAVWPTKLPPGVAAVHTGNPVRAAVVDRAGAPFPDMSGDLRVLVIGGSQGASILSRVVPAALAQLPDDICRRLKVSHQARDADAAAAEAAYGDAGIDTEIRPFFDDVPQRLVDAHLVISRSGASSVADIAAIGRPSILVPLAIAIRDEQTANAQALSAAGAAVVLPEATFSPDALAGHTADILGAPDRARAMATAAATIGRPDAVDRLKSEVLKLAGAP